MNNFPHLLAKETQESEASMMGEIEAADEKQTIDEIMEEATLSDEQTVSPVNMQVAAFRISLE